MRTPQKHWNLNCVRSIWNHRIPIVVDRSVNGTLVGWLVKEKRANQGEIKKKRQMAETEISHKDEHRLCTIDAAAGPLSLMYRKQTQQWIRLSRASRVWKHRYLSRLTSRAISFFYTITSSKPSVDEEAPCLLTIHSKSEKVCGTAFSVKKIAEKVRKSGRHFWTIWG